MIDGNEAIDNIRLDAENNLEQCLEELKEVEDPLQKAFLEGKIKGYRNIIKTFARGHNA